MSDIETFRVRRLEGGSLVRSPDNQAALRYGPIPIPSGAFTNVSLLTRPSGYDTMLVWVRIPARVPWDEALLVRGGFAPPTSPLDGVLVRTFRSSEVNLDTDDDGVNDALSFIVPDTPLTEGNHYYYSLLLRNGLSEDDTQWAIAARTRALLPRDFRMSDHLYQSLPEFYRFVDQNNALDGENGSLRRYLGIMGYALDVSYTMIECGPLSVYDADTTPFPDLLLDMFGLSDEPVLGARRNTMIEAMSDLLSLRGSVLGLERLVEAASGYDCTVEVGSNLLLSPDDSEFINRTGFWFPVTDVVAAAINAVDTDFGDAAAWGTSTLALGTVAPDVGLGSMEVTVGAPGGGIIYGLDNAMSPTTRLLPVNGDTNYFFAFSQNGGAAFNMGIVWFGIGGVVLEVDETVNGPAGGDPVPGAWVEFAWQFLSPPDAVLAAPYIYWKAAGTCHLSAMGVQQVGTAGSGEEPIPPDVTLLLGSSQHLLDNDKSYLE